MTQRRHGRECYEQCRIDQPRRCGQIYELLNRSDSTKEPANSEVRNLLQNEGANTHCRERPGVCRWAQLSWHRSSGQHDCHQNKRRFAENSYGFSERWLQPEYAYRSE